MQANLIMLLLEMNNSVIFASPINSVMRDYQLYLDDNIAIKAEQLFGSEEAFKDWLQKKVEQLLHVWLDDSDNKLLYHNSGLPDEKLAEILKDYPPLTPEDFPELSQTDFNDMVKSQVGHLSEGLEKWL